MFILQRFNVWHLSILAAGVLITVVLWLILHKQSAKTKWIAMIVLQAANVVLYAFRVYRGWYDGANIWEHLPLYLCDFSLVINLISAATKNKLLCHYSYYIASIGAFMALLFPTTPFIEGRELFEIDTILFYVQHIFVANAGFLMYLLGFFKINVRNVLLTNVFLFAFTGAIHFVNLYCIAYQNCDPNYMFTMRADGNPILELFRSWVDADFFYLLPSLGILLVTDLVLSSPVIVAASVRRRKGLSATR